MTELGSMYLSGQGVPASAARAFEWHQRAAEAGDACGAYNAALAARFGRGVGRDPRTALSLFKLAASRGLEGVCAYHIGVMCEAGEGGAGGKHEDEQIAEAVKWYQKSVVARDPMGMTALARLYRKGAGEALQRDPTRALELLLQAGELRCGRSLREAAQMVAAGEGTVKSSARAFDLYRRAAALGDAKAEAVVAAVLARTPSRA